MFFLFFCVTLQEAHEAESRRTVNQILDATNLKNFSKMQFFMLTNGSGEEQDKQVKYMREQVSERDRDRDREDDRRSRIVEAERESTGNSTRTIFGVLLSDSMV